MMMRSKALRIASSTWKVDLPLPTDGRLISTINAHRWARFAVKA
jgi:hypothetical protein